MRISVPCVYASSRGRVTYALGLTAFADMLSFSGILEFVPVRRANALVIGLEFGFVIAVVVLFAVVRLDLLAQVRRTLAALLLGLAGATFLEAELLLLLRVERAFQWVQRGVSAGSARGQRRVIYGESRGHRGYTNADREQANDHREHEY